MPLQLARWLYTTFVFQFIHPAGFLQGNDSIYAAMHFIDRWFLSKNGYNMSHHPLYRNMPPQWFRASIFSVELYTWQSTLWREDYPLRRELVLQPGHFIERKLLQNILSILHIEQFIYTYFHICRAQSWTSLLMEEEEELSCIASYNTVKNHHMNHIPDITAQLDTYFNK